MKFFIILRLKGKSFLVRSASVCYCNYSIRYNILHRPHQRNVLKNMALSTCILTNNLLYCWILCWATNFFLNKTILPYLIKHILLLNWICSFTIIVAIFQLSPIEQWIVGGETSGLSQKYNFIYIFGTYKIKSGVLGKSYRPAFPVALVCVELVTQSKKCIFF